MSGDPMEEIRASFFVECEELIEGMNEALAALASGAGDADTVNTVFRAVHSIKGGAAAFGMTGLVGFAHRFESVLDAVRSDRIDVDRGRTGLLFQGADLLQDHVRAARDGVPPPGGADAVLHALEAFGGEAATRRGTAQPFVPLALGFDFVTGPSGNGGTFAGDAVSGPNPSRPQVWIIGLAPTADLYRSGNEVQHLLRALASLGRATVSCTVPDDLGLDDDAAETPRLSWEVRLEAEVDRADIEALFEFVADVCSVTIKAARDPAPARDAPGIAVARTASADPGPVTLRVELDKIDRLLNVVSELVINQAMLASSIASAGLSSPEVTTGLEAFAALTRDIQESVMAVRAQPVKPLFQRMARVLREAATSEGKAVRLRTEGDATEVDKTLIERLAEPLTHMIRNAVDHGVETPRDRVAAGKPAEGVVTLRACHRAGRIVIEVADDGAGIDRDKVRARAVSRGLITADAALTDAEVDALLFVPGFTTADRVTDLSGRGVGMDVVRSALAGLGGRITITSERGRGTVLSISLPLTLAVLDGMVVLAGGQTFVIPLSAIVETARLIPENIARVGAQTELLQMRGALIPVIDLAARLGFGDAAPGGRGIVLLTAQDDGTRAALIVDAIMEQRQVVIKGLGPLFDRVPGVAAATILGDGQVALILDPADLTHKAGSPGAAGAVFASPAGPGIAMPGFAATGTSGTGSDMTGAPVAARRPLTNSLALASAG